MNHKGAEMPPIQKFPIDICPKLCYNKGAVKECDSNGYQ